MSLVTDDEWAQYKTEHKKSYDKDEDQIRRSLYEKAKAKVEEHNKKYESGEVTWTMGINHMSDFTKEEYEMMCGSRKK
ncbi:protein CTLA-2-beta [Drosophila grimshawi]|uniref:GH17548 n=1 Tax=Drosophila grimshawi TaxID=7222 RepID=B4K4C8_DROGR|nr:protein CTLA-2-beta [Drosophila grimshawi]EDW04387.1 GH17548 [Drosophila grimshawi]